MKTEIKVPKGNLERPFPAALAHMKCTISCITRNLVLCYPTKYKLCNEVNVYVVHYEVKIYFISYNKCVEQNILGF